MNAILALQTLETEPDPAGFYCVSNGWSLTGTLDTD